jgi:hypothetical protein
VAITCTGFDPGATVTLQGVTSAGAATTDAAATATADSNGDVSANYTVNASDTAGITATETTPSSVTAEASFSASANSCIADQNGQTGGSCSTGQGGTTTVNPGPLEMQQASAQITFSNITIDGQPQKATGTMNQVTVADFRGGVLGWSLNATAGAFTGSNGGTLPAADLSITPTCVNDPAALAAAGGPFPSTVTAGAASAMGAQVNICTEAANATLTGGVFDAGGALTLALPAYLRAGTYTNTITFSLG